MTFEDITRNPLCWPQGRPRTPTPIPARFLRKLTVARALDDLSDELDRLGIDASSVIVSSNVALRRDGLPRSGQRTPDDAGVAVYFHLDGQPLTLACDKWDRVEHNLRAITLHIEATRGLERWGVGSLKEAFAGYKALPPSAKTNGTRYFDHLAEPASIRARYRELALTHHPDRGGDPLVMVEINEQYQQAIHGPNHATA